MGEDVRVVCDRCHAYRAVLARVPVTPSALRHHPRLGPFVREHEDCEPPLRIALPADESIEHYREHYEEA
jgi:hypothetical protein